MTRLVPLVFLAACSTDASASSLDASDSGDVTGDPCPTELAGTTRCSADGLLESCVGGMWQRAACPGLTRCDAGACLPPACTPGSARCDDALTRAVCNDEGTRFVAAACPDGPCVDGRCELGCTPGARRCDGLTPLECSAERRESPLTPCDGAAGEQCIDGRCISACEIRGAKRGYLACDFWGADLPNDETAIDNIFAFAFSNASPRPATVTLTYPWGPIATVTVPVGGVAAHPLPVPRVLSQITAPGLGRFGFHIESDQPIAAFMFNPLERYDDTAEHSVATNDASILIPATALGTSYLALTWSDPAEFSRPPYVVVVATRDDTQVTVTTPEVVTLAQSPFIVRPDVPATFTLAAHETLNLEPPGTAGLRTDMTGTRIEATQPVAVFAGNRCARVPDAGRFCDHLEKQMPPLETWGDAFVVTKFTDRGGEADYFRVLAQEDGTALTFDPPRDDAPTLAAGALWQFSSRADFALVASHPVLLGQFMASQSTTTAPGPYGVSGSCPPEIGGTCQGDPSMLLPAPVAQWREDQIFLVPDTYRHQFINVAFAEGTTLRLDETPVATSAARLIGSGTWRGLTLTTAGGYHSLVASAPVAVVVYGFDHNISYAYNGGLDFRRLR